MPGQVKATIGILIALAVIVGYSAVVQDTLPWVRLGLMAFLLWGIFRRSALAWQYLRVVGMLAFIAAMAAMISNLLTIQSTSHPPAYAVAMGVSLVMTSLFVVPIFLVGTKPARHYFNVICPACGSAKVKAMDFVYREKRCKKCRHTWR
jgi:uncharacterized protein YqgC (DUF456 family)